MIGQLFLYSLSLLKRTDVKPKSDNDILNNLKDLSPDEIFKKSVEFNFVDKFRNNILSEISGNIKVFLKDNK